MRTPDLRGILVRDLQAGEDGERPAPRIGRFLASEHDSLLAAAPSRLWQPKSGRSGSEQRRVGATGPLPASDADRMEEMIRLNVGALTRLTYAAAPRFVERGTGTIINIASIVGMAPEILNGVYGGTKAFVLAFSRSLQKELAEKNVRVHVVVPGVTATAFWGIAGTPVEHLPSEIVMPAEEMVDAAFSGFDQGEFITIPSLPDVRDWEAYEAARQTLVPNLSHRVPAARYRAAVGK